MKNALSTDNLEVLLFDGQGYSRELFCKIKQSYDFSSVITVYIGTVWQDKLKLCSRTKKMHFQKSMNIFLSTSYKNENQLEF